MSEIKFELGKWKILIPGISTIVLRSVFEVICAIILEGNLLGENIAALPFTCKMYETIVNHTNPSFPSVYR